MGALHCFIHVEQESGNPRKSFTATVLFASLAAFSEYQLETFIWATLRKSAA